MCIIIKSTFTCKATYWSLVWQYRYRIGDYRAIFSVAADGTITLLTILSVKHRKDVYR
ncbi:MAG: hypothetical protein KBC35_01275 [Candidatus Pacebacteria bacterium]|nr:hypothetical protein [Candidatus Paceibacterota bacterium]